LNQWGDPLTIETEFAELGVPVARANNNPRAGFTRLRELMKLDPAHRFPDWHPQRGEPGSPRLFIVKRAVPELVDQISAAPLQPIEKRYAGEQVDSEWEGRYGHAVAALRYGAMSRPDASEKPEERPNNPDWDEAQRARAEWMYELRKKRDDPVVGRAPLRYET
jgi:hypothetical protein